MNARETTSSDRRKRKHRLLPWLALAGLVLAIGAACAHRFWFTLPVGEGPAGPAVDRAPFQKTWSTRRVLLVGLGDSITAGLGARKGYSYFDRIRNNPPEEWPEMKGLCLASVFPNLESTNLAVSGSTSLEHARHQIPRLPQTDSNTLVIVTMSSGGNDLIHNYGRTPAREGGMFGATWEQAQPWLQNFDRRLNEMLGRIHSQYSNRCHVFLADIYDPSDGVGDLTRMGLPPWKDGPRLHAAYNTIIERACAQHPRTHKVGILDPFLGHGIYCTQIWRTHYRSSDPHYWYFSNLEDPNERGYDALRRLFLNEIARVAEEMASMK